MSPRSNQKPSFGQRSTLEKHVTSMSCRLEPAIRSRDTGQQIPYFDRCQLIITWMSDIKEVHGKPRLHVSLNLLLEYGRHVARLHRRRRRRRRRAYAPTSNTASHGTHEKIISWVPFSSLIWVWGSAWRPSAAGAPLLETDHPSRTSWGKRTVARLTIPVCINTGKQTDHPSRRAIAIFRLFRRIILDNSSRRMIRRCV